MPTEADVKPPGNSPVGEQHEVKTKEDEPEPAGFPHLAAITGIPADKLEKMDKTTLATVLSLAIRSHTPATKPSPSSSRSSETGRFLDAWRDNMPEFRETDNAPAWFKLNETQFKLRQVPADLKVRLAYSRLSEGARGWWDRTGCTKAAGEADEWEGFKKAVIDENYSPSRELDDLASLWSVRQRPGRNGLAAFDIDFDRRLLLVPDLPDRHRLAAYRAGLDPHLRASCTVELNAAAGKMELAAYRALISTKDSARWDAGGWAAEVWETAAKVGEGSGRGWLKGDD